MVALVSNLLMHYRLYSTTERNQWQQASAQRPRKLNLVMIRGCTTSTTLQWYMIAGTTPKSHLRSRPTCHTPIIIKPDTDFWHRLQISTPSEIKTQRNRINCMRCTSPNVHLSKIIHDWRRPLRIVTYRAIIYASFSKRAPMTVTWSNFVNNTLIAYIYQRVYTRMPRRNQGTCIVYLFVGPRNRHWGTFAKRCINNRAMRRGQCQSCIVLERCTFGEVHRMQFILFLCVFISDGALIWRRC